MCWLFYWLLIFSLLHLARERLARFNCWSSLEKFQNAQTLILSSILCRDGAIFKKLSPSMIKSVHSSCVPTHPMCRWAYVHIDPMFLLILSTRLILCSNKDDAPNDPMFPLILCSRWSYVSTDPVFPLIPCTHWSRVPYDPMHPLILRSH